MKYAKIAAACGLAAAVAGTGIFFSAKAQAQTVPQTLAVQSDCQFGHHPDILRALNNLEQADRELNHAPHVFDGHRAAAEKLTNEAIQQVKQALAYKR